MEVGTKGFVIAESVVKSGDGSCAYQPERLCTPYGW